jgi:hypothetical protein
VYESKSSNEKSILKRAQKSIRPLDKDFDAALQAFMGEASAYSEGISDQTARQYALRVTLLLENRAREVEIEEPRHPGMFEPNRNLIRSTLKSIYERHFAGSDRPNVKAPSDFLPALS